MSWIKRDKFNKYENLPKKSTLLEEYNNKEFTSDILQNEKILKETFQDCSDLEYRRIDVNHNTHWLIVYIDNLIDKKMLEEHVIKPMIASVKRDTFPEEAGDLKSEIVSIGTTNSSTKVSETVRNVLEGNAAILTTGSSNVMTVSIRILSKYSLLYHMYTGGKQCT
ncbi:hypothetical protein GC102_10870 [Paenibacillus sp. LMG 31460]|uniref:Uncharacterized protein n=1 Tax=Paenibacillus germinis TaxID=2654979 RepID=A0ABX1Z2W3_9BACL|nr:spore germination protein [Paenibacillus germinis]NOU86273.1 hypothetical protein [Paenibacillus germinis]